MGKAKPFAIACAALGLPTLTAASGYLPLPPETESFPSHPFCVAALEAALEHDRKQVSPLTLEANGERREVSLSTKGIERLDPQAARYDGTLWYHHGRPRPDLPQPGIETSHSFEQRRRQCDGAVMTTSGAQGFTQPTFETEPPVQ